jgi:hypothetical protein
MTKAILAAACALALAGPAFAEHAPAAAPVADPCVLGAGAAAGCTGAVRVIERVTTTGPVMSSSATSAAPRALGADPRTWTPEWARTPQGPTPLQPAMPTAHAQAPIHAPPASAGPAPVPPPAPAGCQPIQGGRMVTCAGQWVPAVALPGPAMPPAPVLVPTPMPVAQPLPAFTPPPMPMAAPAPAMMHAHLPPAPRYEAIAPGHIPTSFFIGGINYGVGFPTETTFAYGGGGAIFVGGGARFSGVRERAPFPLNPPKRKPRGGGHHGGGGGCGCH